MEGPGRRADRVERHHPARHIPASDHLRAGCRGGVEAHAAGSEEHQAQGPEGLDHRRQADEAARYRAKLNGSKVYAIDLKLPGMLNAAIKDAPVYGSKIKSVDEAKVAKMPGVRKVVRVKDTAVAVVADTWWQAKTALDALPIVWDEGENAKVSSATIAKHLETGLTATETNGDRRHGDALAAIAGAAKKVEATYSTPFLSHACMEVMNATVRITADKAECWTPTQNLEASLAALSSESGLPLSQCEVYRHDLGGGFGRRGGTQDYVRKAVVVAKEFPGVPVKTIWSREEDQTHDFFRPISMCKFSAGLEREEQAGRPACPGVGPVDQRLAQSGGDGRRPGHASAAGVLRNSRATRSSATPCRTC